MIEICKGVVFNHSVLRKYNFRKTTIYKRSGANPFQALRQNHFRQLLVFNKRAASNFFNALWQTIF